MQCGIQLGFSCPKAIEALEPYNTGEKEFDLNAILVIGKKIKVCICPVAAGCDAADATNAGGPRLQKGAAPMRWKGYPGCIERDPRCSGYWLQRVRGVGDPASWDDSKDIK